jgi:hypothetical protein
MLHVGRALRQGRVRLEATFKRERNQEMMYRERALLDTDRKEFWLAKADEWAQRAVDEIALQFRESKGVSFTAV